MTYEFHKVHVRDWYPALEPLFKSHYREMQDRFERDGIDLDDYDPRLEEYFAAADRDEYQMFIVLENGTLIGYCGIWVVRSMHCKSELIATEDALYAIPERRKGVGKPLVRHVLSHLRSIGCRRASITPVTDLRVGKIWQKMGFVPVAQLMVWNFDKESA